MGGGGGGGGGLFLALFFVFGWGGGGGGGGRAKANHPIRSEIHGVSRARAPTTAPQAPQACGRARPAPRPWRWADPGTAPCSARCARRRRCASPSPPPRSCRS